MDFVQPNRENDILVSEFTVDQILRGSISYKEKEERDKEIKEAIEKGEIEVIELEISPSGETR